MGLDEILGWGILHNKGLGLAGGIPNYIGVEHGGPQRNSARDTKAGGTSEASERGAGAPARV